MHVNADAIRGEPGTGYQDPQNGQPFNCEHCEYFDPDDVSCGQKDMKRLSKRPRTKKGRVSVSPKGCCIYEDGSKEKT